MLVADALDEAVPLERVDDLGDRRRRHLLLRGERAERERTFTVDDRERGEERGRVPAVVLLPQQPGHPEHGLAEPARDRDGVRRGRRSGGGRRADP